jgi:hypothetical protein
MEGTFIAKRDTNTTQHPAVASLSRGTPRDHRAQGKKQEKKKHNKEPKQTTKRATTGAPNSGARPEGAWPLGARRRKTEARPTPSSHSKFNGHRSHCQAP